MQNQKQDPAKAFIAATNAAIKTNKTADPIKAVAYWGQKQPARPAAAAKKTLK